MTTVQAEIVVRESYTKKQLINQAHNNLDDYFRLISSLSGNMLASVTNLKQLTMYDIQSKSLISNFTLQNVIYCAFNENSTILAVTTRVPSIHLYQIIQTTNSQSNATTTKSLIELQQIRPLSMATSYGWIVSTLDNGYFYYTQNDQIFSINSVTFQIRIVNNDSAIRTKCAPYYLIMDREYKHLVSVSKIGQVCTFNVTVKSSLEQTQYSYWPEITLLQSLNLSTNTTTLTISDMNQSDKFILVSTSKVTDYNSSFYNTFVISKENINVFSKIRLQQQLMAPPLTIMSENVEDYLLAFLKGEQSLYIYDLRQLQKQQNTTIINSLNQTNFDMSTLSYISKQSMQFLMQGINYNNVDRVLMMGISSTKNEDKIISVDFGFNCSNITQIYREEHNISLVSNESNQVRQMCMQQCEEVMSGSVFSFPQRKCVVQSASQVSNVQQCRQSEPSYQWNIYGQQCQLQCPNIANTLSQVPFGQPEQCYCQQTYIWDGMTSSCFSPIIMYTTNFTTQSNSTSTAISNSTTNSNSFFIIFLQIQMTTKAAQIMIKFHNLAVRLVWQQVSLQDVLCSLYCFFFQHVTSLITISIDFLLYKRKKLCFRQSSSQSYIKQLQLKQTQSAKSSEDDNKSDNHNKQAQNPQSDTGLINVPQKQEKQSDKIVGDDEMNNIDSQRVF